MKKIYINHDIKKNHLSKRNVWSPNVVDKAPYAHEWSLSYQPREARVIHCAGRGSIRPHPEFIHDCICKPGANHCFHWYPFWERAEVSVQINNTIYLPLNIGLPRHSRHCRPRKCLIQYTEFDLQQKVR